MTGPLITSVKTIVMAVHVSLIVVGVTESLHLLREYKCSELWPKRKLYL